MQTKEIHDYLPNFEKYSQEAVKTALEIALDKKNKPSVRIKAIDLLLDRDLIKVEAK